MKNLSKPQFTSSDVQILNKSSAYKGFFNVCHYQLKHRLFEGGWSKTLSRELFERRAVAAILPYDPIQDKVVLIEQFRLGAMDNPQGPWLLEVVAGISEPNESVEALVHRELNEEAGLKAQALLPIHEYWISPGGSSEFMSLFCGWVDASQAGGIHGLDHEYEDIKVHTLSSHAAFKAMASGRINNSAAIIALQWLQLNKTSIQHQWQNNTPQSR